MSYGLEILRNDGTKIVSDTMPGGRCFVQVLTLATQTLGTTSTYTFSNVPGGESLRLYTMKAGMHSWSTGTNLSGQAVLNVTAYGTFPAIQSRLLVFAVKTTESFSNDIGISLVNDQGERTVSALYPCSEFLGKVTLNSTPTTTATTADGYNWYTHDLSTSLGANRTRFILWNLPSNSDDTWYAGDAYVSSGTSGSYSLQMQVATKAGSYTLPEGFVFGLDGISASSDTYGVRIYDAGSSLTFDAGLDHMVIKAIEQGIAFDTSGATNTYTLSSLGSGTPAYSLPPFYSERWTADPNPLNISSHVVIKQGFIKRDGSDYKTQVITLQDYTEDSRKNINWTWGVTSGLVVLVVNSALYGGTNL